MHLLRNVADPRVQPEMGDEPVGIVEAGESPTAATIEMATVP